jgi:flagellar hook-associated protein 1 FlgK
MALRSTFAGFNTAQLAMAASQRALDVTGQNLANINTPGYTRQRLDLTSISPEGASISSSPYDIKVGQGVRMEEIERIRDPFLDVQYRNQLPKVGTADAMDAILAEIGNVFDETDKNAVCQKLSNIISQLQVMASPDNAATSTSDSLVRSACEIFLDTIHQNATDIKGVQKDLIQKLNESVVPNVNTCLEQIRNLNISIKNSQILGNPALELQDQRDELIDALATYFPIDVKYTTENYGAGISVDVLDISVKLKDGTKINLVSDDMRGSIEIKTTPDANGVPGNPVSLHFMDTEGNKSIDAADMLENGVLKGDMDMVNKSEVYDNPPSDTKGIGFYIKGLDKFVAQFAEIMNKWNEPNGKLFETSDGSDEFTASNIVVSDAWMSGKAQIKIQKTGDEDLSTDYTNVLQMIDDLTNTRFAVESNGEQVFKGTLAEIYTNLWNTQAIERQASSTILENHQTVADQISNAKDSVSGVYMDEEVMNLMRFQQSYNAAARLMTTLDEILERLITGTGVVGR